MSKKFPKLPVAPVEGFFFVFSQDDWEMIESKEVYDCKLPQSARDLLSLATLFLTLYLPLDKSAPRLHAKAKQPDVVKQLADIKAGAQKLRAELYPPRLWADNYQPSEVARMGVATRLGYELDTIREEEDIGPGSVPNEFSILRFSLGAIILACGEVLKKIEKGVPLREGEAWKIWIVLLTMIMKSHNLPWGARKDAYKIRTREETFVTQPFLRLILYLHKLLRIELPYRTAGGLAKAINRARAARPIDVSSVDDAERFIYEVLGMWKQRPASMQLIVDKVLEGHRLVFNPADMQFMVDQVLKGHMVGMNPVDPGPLGPDDY